MEIFATILFLLNIFLILPVVVLLIQQRAFVWILTGVTSFLTSVFGFILITQPIVQNSYLDLNVTDKTLSSLLYTSVTLVVLLSGFTMYYAWSYRGLRKAHKTNEAMQDYLQTAERAATETLEAELRELFIAEAETFFGSKNEPGMNSKLLLQENELLYAKVENGVGLIEMKKTPSRWRGRTAGLSIPLFRFNGSTVRGQIGGTEGELIPGQYVPQKTDDGVLYVTNQRVVFLGEHTVREIPLRKLLSFEILDTNILSFSVSGRVNPVMVLLAGSSQRVETAAFRVRLALADLNGTRQELLTALKSSESTN